MRTHSCHLEELGFKVKGPNWLLFSGVGQNQCQRHDVSRFVNWVHSVICSEPSKGSYWGTGSWLVYLVLKRWTAGMDSHRAAPPSYTYIPPSYACIPSYIYIPHISTSHFPGYPDAAFNLISFLGNRIDREMPRGIDISTDGPGWRLVPSFSWSWIQASPLGSS